MPCFAPVQLRHVDDQREPRLYDVVEVVKAYRPQTSLPFSCVLIRARAVARGGSEVHGYVRTMCPSSSAAPGMRTFARVQGGAAKLGAVPLVLRIEERTVLVYSAVRGPHADPNGVLEGRLRGNDILL